MVERLAYIVKELVNEAPDVITLKLAPESGTIFDFKPGQFVSLLIAMREGPVPFLSKPYSISSSPTNKEFLGLTIKITEREGSFPKLVAKFRPGDKVTLMGPFGVFTFDPDKHKDVVMIAGGVGITPFHSMIAYATDKKLSNKLLLLFSNKTCSETIFYKDFDSFVSSNPNFKFICTATREEQVSMEGIETGRFDADRILSACGGSVEGKHFMLCGSTPFVEGFRNLLLVTMRVPKERVLYELFGSGV
ncbi:MAG: FAD-binding oxidoreductase [Candidatus Burarchaeum sp.]|nr:FAD-binding oxidoreductase [Candidatus Burarchaeum sp.]MDO8340325.1 FAD-binding oxidoreductase [Candidatus Burarchaeum sp.]